MSANRRQVGGTHYKDDPIGHWDYCLVNQVPYMEAQIIKYIVRHKKKNGIEDLKKAIHYTEKLIEWEGMSKQERILAMKKQMEELMMEEENAEKSIKSRIRGRRGI